MLFYIIEPKNGCAAAGPDEWGFDFCGDTIFKDF